MNKGENLDGVSAPRTVRRRHILYVPGFDPRGPSYYHGVALREAAKAQRISAAKIEVTARKGNQWTVAATIDQLPVQTTYEILRWDDLVRKSWIKNEFVLLGRAVRWVVACRRTGILTLTHAQAHPFYMAAVAPTLAGVSFVMMVLLGMTLLALAGGWLAASAGLPALAGYLLAVPLAAAARSIWRRIDPIINICWLNRAFDYVLELATGRIDQTVVADRVSQFAQRIGEVARQLEIDEVLVVGHSLGAMHAVAAVAEAVAGQAEVIATRPRLVLVTLGQLLPVTTMLSTAGQWRQMLRTFANDAKIEWLDVTSLSDPASTCGIDPLHDIPVSHRRDFPRRFDPAFHEILTSETFWYIRRRPLDFHFQYIKASERSGGYDYFRLMFGPQFLFGPEPPR